jgi:hypothetical protein
VKWLPATGSVQRSADFVYMVMQANSMDWVAYYTPKNEPAEEIAVRPTDEAARTACDEHQRALIRRA